MTNPLPAYLPTLEDDLRRASEALPDVGKVRTPEQIPKTVLLMREARLQDQIRLAEKKRRDRHQKRKIRKLQGKRVPKHYQEKQAERRASRRQDPFLRYLRFCESPVEKGLRQMTYLEFLFVYCRVVPTDRKENLMHTRRLVRFLRKDSTKPWTVENLQDVVKVQARYYQWRKLPHAPEYEEYKLMDRSSTSKNKRIFRRT